VTRTVTAILRDPEQADDAVQETFARGLGRLDSLREADRFAPWLKSIARHVATDRLRDRARVRASSDDESLDGVADGPGPEELAELGELSRLVEAGITQLSPRDATAVALVTHLGFTINELAIALGVSPGAAKVTVHRARRRLRDALFVQLLERGYQTGCADVPPVVEEDDASLARVVQHVLACDACIRALTSEVRGYEFAPLSSPAGPVPSVEPVSSTPAG
jgi:RNA polymerase sigma-70 factor (ECF subfamily)